MSNQKSSRSIHLPEPVYTSKLSVEEALLKRRSVREYTNKPLTLAEVSQLLWAAQGITDPIGLRTAPSAGALYPLEAYVIAANIEDLPSGIYKYKPQGHMLIMVAQGDKRAAVARFCFGQGWIADSSAIILFSAVYERTTKKYGDRGMTYVHMEIGHAAQNVSLQAVSLNLGTVVIGAFDNKKIKELMQLPDDEEPLCLMPVGHISN